MIKPLRYLSMLIMLLSVTACLEEFIPETETGTQGLLVVDARITNEMKRHSVMLSRTSPVGKDTLLFENGAQIQVVSENASYPYTMVGDGNYVSNSAFSAQPGASYRLEITLGNGKNYASEMVTTPEIAEITSVYAVRENNPSGEDGVSIYVDGQGSPNGSGLYRYEFEETYKVIAPNWVERQFSLTNYDPCALPVPTFDLRVIPETYERKTCYGADDSKRIIQFSTKGLAEDRVERFPVLFISKDNYIITHRYSILVKQLVDTPDAFAFYEKLSDIANGNGGLSGVQPGFINGNIKSLDNTNEEVVGYFSSSTVSEMRTFFDFEDIFPGEEKPAFVDPCVIRRPKLNHISYCFEGLAMDPCPVSLVEELAQDNVAYIDTITESPVCNPIEPYLVVNKLCGDCTVLGTNVKPDFWED